MNYLLSHALLSLKAVFLKIVLQPFKLLFEANGTMDFSALSSLMKNLLISFACPLAAPFCVTFLMRIAAVFESEVADILQSVSTFFVLKRKI